MLLVFSYMAGVPVFWGRYEYITCWSCLVAVTSGLSRDGHSKGDDATCIPYISSGSCSRLLSEFHILSEIGRGAFGDVIKVRTSFHSVYFCEQYHMPCTWCHAVSFEVQPGRGELSLAHHRLKFKILPPISFVFRSIEHTLYMPSFINVSTAVSELQDSDTAWTDIWPVL